MMPIAAIIPAIRANIGMVLNVVIFVSGVTAGVLATRYVYLRVIEGIQATHAKEQAERQEVVVASLAAALEAQSKREKERENAHQIIAGLMRNADRDIAAVTERMRVRAIQTICSGTMPASGVEAASTGGELLDAYLASVEEVRRESIEAVKACELDRF